MRAVARERRRHVTCGEAPADKVAVGARCHIPDRSLVFDNRLVTHDVGITRRNLHHHEASLRSGTALGQRGTATDEVGLFEVDEPVEPCFRRRVIGAEILVERAVSLFETQAREGTAAEMP